MAKQQNTSETPSQGVLSTPATGDTQPIPTVPATVSSPVQASAPAPLTEEQKRAIEAAKTVPSRRTVIVENLDGSFTLSIRISPESAAYLREWAKMAQVPLDLYTQQQIDEALNSYCASAAG